VWKGCPPQSYGVSAVAEVGSAPAMQAQRQKIGRDAAPTFALPYAIASKSQTEGEVVTFW
jgi:hypothetical protein